MENYNTLNKQDFVDFNNEKEKFLYEVENKKEFYEGEIKRLNDEVRVLKNKLKLYNEFEEDVLNSIKRHCEMLDKRLSWESEK